MWPEEATPVYMLVPRSMFFEFIPVEDSGEEQPSVRNFSKVTGELRNVAVYI